MTATAPSATRANRNGHPCPEWCTVDHDEEAAPGLVRTTHSSDPVHAAAWTAITAVRFPARREPEVQVCTPGADGGSIFLPAEKAGYLAGLIEALASATPEQHRELAAAIRQAAAQITGAPAAACPDHRPVFDSAVGWYCAACGSDAPPAA